ncbi:GTP-binding protein [Carboxylicivirga sediminis]|uniref:GTP-binding protein n=1 Tax=Carboxylicivirga sediminis TaxID=2006564 RepID=A0A941F1E0_9BACT|nr:CobW family GTP-binding protein [Carboxylicivirga sediminis]MBR8534025.1 GTP-binding protein [Carboxylicivirga sediminis]
MAKFNLITGFLGSGKTTLLSHLLAELSVQKRIAVIQNEFAPTGIDGKELKQKNNGFKLVEINNGSVFCVCQLNTFIQSLEQLMASFQPEIIFLEASGLADPISIVELLQSDGLKDKITLDKIISVVDAQNFYKGLNTLVRFKHQIMIADQIIINKTDCLQGNIWDIQKDLRNLNPFAEIQSTTYGRVDWLSLEGSNANKNEAAVQFIGKESAGRPDMNSCVLRTHDKIAETSLYALIKELQQQCPRIKGYLNLSDGQVMSVHSVFETEEYKILKGYEGPTELIAFGNELNVVKLRQLFKQYKEN